MKRLSIGFLLWLTDDNISRRLEMCKQTINSLSLLNNHNLYDLLITNNGGIVPKELNIPSNSKIIHLDKNFYDISALYVPYLHALENNHDYFCYSYDDFEFLKDSFEDCIKFLDENKEVDCMRITSYVFGNPSFNTKFTSKQKNPDSVGHGEGAAKFPLIQMGPFYVGNNSFFKTNWKPNSRPTIWRTKSYQKFFADLKTSKQPVMTVYEDKIYNLCNYHFINGEYQSSFLDIGMCKTFLQRTSERMKFKNNFWANCTIDMKDFLNSYNKSK